ncbi:protein-cysteine N-palmitoyltransferase HHAT-like [Clytia hemisphaerica]|uniref:protein-cysteine N-palmitoyltransferase HHAT-like n=1 Tax=Clytia hemisphaerica TaxID=252671 RepID=UPI0034D7A4C2
MQSVFQIMSKIEKTIIWSLTCIFSLYSFYVAYTLRQTYGKTASPSSADGDYEYNAWRKSVVSLTAMNVVYLASCYSVRNNLPGRYHKPCRLAMGLVMLSSILSVNAMVLMVAYMGVFFVLVAASRSKVVVWLAILFSIHATQSRRMMNVPFDFFGVERQYETVCRLCLFIAYLKCLDFGCDVVYKTSPQAYKNNEISKSGETKDVKVDDEDILQKLLDFLDYIFYVPLFFHGPVFTMKDFTYGDKHRASINKIEVLKDAFTCVVYTFFMDQVIFKYTSTTITKKYPGFLHDLSGFDSMLLASYHVQIFCVIYVIFYRFGGLFTKLDGHVPPGTPKCAHMMLTFTNMWRTFDQGLYKILQKNIYFPMGGSRRGLPMQLLSSFFCFVFVAYWHGGQRANHIVWGLLNWLGIIIEAIGRFVMQRYASKDFMRNNLVLSVLH